MWSLVARENVSARVHEMWSSVLGAACVEQRAVPSGWRDSYSVDDVAFHPKRADKVIVLNLLGRHRLLLLLLLLGLLLLCG